MSNKNMTLTEIEKSSKQFKDTHTVSVSGFSGGNRITAAYVLEVTTKAIEQLSNLIEQLNKVVYSLQQEMREGFKQINARIDNLIVKNNLKE